MEIVVFGSCCGHTATLMEMIEKIIEEMGLEDKISVKFTEDTIKIMSYGTVSTPGLVVNGKLKVKGRLPSNWEIRAYIQEELRSIS